MKQVVYETLKSYTRTRAQLPARRLREKLLQLTNLGAFRSDEEKTVQRRIGRLGQILGHLLRTIHCMNRM